MAGIDEFSNSSQQILSRLDDGLKALIDSSYVSKLPVIKIEISELPKIRAAFSRVIEELPGADAGKIRPGYLKVKSGETLKSVLFKINALDSEEKGVVPLKGAALALLHQLPITPSGSCSGYLKRGTLDSILTLHEKAESLFITLIKKRQEKSAVKDKDVEDLVDLIDKWSIFSKEQQLHNKFLKAIDNEDIPTLKRLMKTYGVKPSGRGIAGETFLSQAVRNDSMEVAEFLIEEGADANALNADGSAPLIIAVCNGSLTMVQFLVSKVTDPELLLSPLKHALEHREDSNDALRIYEVLMEVKARLVDGADSLDSGVQNSSQLVS